MVLKARIQTTWGKGLWLERRFGLSFFLNWAIQVLLKIHSSRKIICRSAQGIVSVLSAALCLLLFIMVWDLIKAVGDAVLRNRRKKKKKSRKKASGATGLKHVAEKWNDWRCGGERNSRSRVGTEVVLRGFKLPWSVCWYFHPTPLPWCGPCLCRRASRREGRGAHGCPRSETGGNAQQQLLLAAVHCLVTATALDLSEGGF